MNNIIMNLLNFLIFLGYAIAATDDDPKKDPKSLKDIKDNYLNQIRNYSMQDMIYKKVNTFGTIVLSCVGAILGLMTIFPIESLKEVHLALANGFSLQSTLFMFLYPIFDPFNIFFASLSIGLGVILTLVPQTRLHVTAIASMGIGSLFLLVILDISKGMFVYIAMLMYLISFEVVIWTGFLESILLSIVFSTSSTYFICCFLHFLGIPILDQALSTYAFGIVKALAKVTIISVLIFFAAAPMVFSIVFASSKKSTPTV